MIKAILFDLDDTLLWDEWSVKEAFERTCRLALEKYDIDPDDLEKSVRKNARELYQSYSTYEFTQMIGINPFEGLWGEFPDEGEGFIELKKIVPEYRTESWTKGLSDLGIDDPELGYELGEAFPRKRKETARLYDDSLEVLDSLREQYKLALLTNGSPALQKIKLDLSPELKEYFEHIIISGDFGAGKPDPAIFNHALSLLEMSSEEVIMVGDNLNTDILGAIRTEITSVWLNRKGIENPEIKPDYEIENLSELVELLHEL